MSLSVDGSTAAARGDACGGAAPRPDAGPLPDATLLDAYSRAVIAAARRVSPSA